MRVAPWKSAASAPVVALCAHNEFFRRPHNAARLQRNYAITFTPARAPARGISLKLWKEIGLAKTSTWQLGCPQRMLPLCLGRVNEPMPRLWPILILAASTLTFAKANAPATTVRPATLADRELVAWRPLVHAAQFSDV